MDTKSFLSGIVVGALIVVLAVISGLWRTNPPSTTHPIILAQECSDIWEQRKEKIARDHEKWRVKYDPDKDLCIAGVSVPDDSVVVYDLVRQQFIYSWYKSESNAAGMVVDRQGVPWIEADEVYEQYFSY